MKTLLPIITAQLSAGNNVAMATVLASKGSAPRGSGACQLLLTDGSTAGTVGGGVLEHRALQELGRLLNIETPHTAEPISIAVDAPSAWITLPASGSSSVQEYTLTQDDVQNLGMVCGGNVSLAYQLLTPSLLPLFSALNNCLLRHKNVWLLRQFGQGQITHIGFTDSISNPTTLPDDQLYFSLGRKAVWNQPVADTHDNTFQGVMVEPVSFISHTYIFGGGHVAQQVAPLLAQLDFAPVIYDDRPEFSNPDLFPTADKVICAPFSEAAHHTPITADDEIVIMTRGHANDLAILTYALRTQAYYIGLIGSRSKIAHTQNMLLQQGFTQADFSRVHTPIGIPILAETPMEIAVSVAAEMIRCRAEWANETSV